MQTMQEYKCPCCGGAIEFNSSLQKMKCPFCDTEFEMETLEGYDAELQNERQDQMERETAAAARSWAMPIWRPHPVRSAETRLS